MQLKPAILITGLMAALVSTVPQPLGFLAALSGEPQRIVSKVARAGPDDESPAYMQSLFAALALSSSPPPATTSANPPHPTPNAKPPVFMQSLSAALATSSSPPPMTNSVKPAAPTTSAKLHPPVSSVNLPPVVPNPNQPPPAASTNPRPTTSANPSTDTPITGGPAPSTTPKTVNGKATGEVAGHNFDSAQASSFLRTAMPPAWSSVSATVVTEPSTDGRPAETATQRAMPVDTGGNLMLNGGRVPPRL